MTTEPIWLAVARKYMGLKEYPGAATNPKISGWLARLKAAWRDDQTAWCGTFIADCFIETGYPPVKGWAGARNWLNYGLKLEQPVVGCVVVFWRGSPKGWSGHVGFVVGADKSNNLMVLGGNQGNAVSIHAFSRDRVLGYRWPSPGPIISRYTPLPLLASDGRVSTNEA